LSETLAMPAAASRGRAWA